MVWARLASLMFLSGDSAFTIQKSALPVALPATMRMGAPLANAPIAPSVPTPMPISAARDHRLLGFAGTLRAQRLEFDAVSGIGSDAGSELDLG
jgi:hypothetical protein